MTLFKQLLSSTLIFSILLMNPSIAYSAEPSTEKINCGSPKDDYEKDYCLMKDRKTKNQADSVGNMGQGALEALTVIIAATAAMTIQVNSSMSSQGKQCPVFFGRILEPILVGAGSVLLIFAEIASFFQFKNDCEDLLQLKGVSLAGRIAEIDKQAGPDATLSGYCTEANLEKESQVSDYCRAKACTLRTKWSAEKKVKHLEWAKMAYMSAATIELTNIIINLAKGAFCSVVYTTATVCSSWQPISDCYSYAITEDAEIKNLIGSYNRKNNIDTYIVDTLNYTIEQQKHKPAVISQLTHSANYVETLMLLEDYQRLARGEVVSSSIAKYDHMMAMNINNLDQENSVKEVLKIGLAMTNELNPIKSAEAKFDMKELLTSVGLAGAMTAMAFESVRSAVTNVIKQAWKYPAGRVAYFGALWGLTYANQSNYKNRIVNELADRSASFDEKIAAIAAPSFEMPDIPTPPAITMPSITVTIPPIKTPKTADVKPPTDCINEEGNKDKNCECIKNNKCYDMKLPTVSLPQGQSFPTPLTNTMKNMKDLTRSYSRGDMAKADLASKNLSAGSGALAGEFSKLKKKVNEELIKGKQAPIDFDKESKKIQNDLLKAVAAAVGAPAPSGATASSGSGGGGGSDSKKADGKDASPSQTINSSSAGGGVAIGGNTGAPSAKEEGLDLGLDGLAEAEMGKMDEAGKVAGLDAYEFKAEDINKKSDENLFKNISGRYLKTAYPVLLKELKTEPADKKK